MRNCWREFREILKCKNRISFDTGRTTILCSGLILVLILLDQVAKHEALLHLKDHSSISLIPGVLELAYVENRGMAFGMLEGRQFLFGGMCVIFCIALIWVFVRIPKNRYYLPLLLTGAVLFGGQQGTLLTGCSEDMWWILSIFP